MSKNRSEALVAKWEAAREARQFVPGVEINLPEGPALVLDRGPANGQWWAWSTTLQAYALVQAPSKRSPGWYEYRSGSGESLDLIGKGA